VLEMHNVLIVGLGLIGGSYAKGLSKKGYNVFGIDKNIDTINLAYNEKVIKNNNIGDDFSIKSFGVKSSFTLLVGLVSDVLTYLENESTKCICTI
jgi:prephenate dehydrogenase